jgi:hypothetical protein
MRDTERPRDEIERLEAEIEELGGLPPSNETNARIERLRRRRNLLVQLAEDRRHVHNVGTKLAQARGRRRKLLKDAKDTRAVDERIAKFEQENREGRARFWQNRMLESVLREREAVPPPDNDAYLRDLENELDASAIDEVRLSELERQVNLEITGYIAENPLDPESFENVSRAADEQGDRLRDAVAVEMEDVDDVQGMIDEYLAMSPLPSPQQTAAVQASVDRLRTELNEERERLRSYDMVLAAEYRTLIEARGQIESSNVDARLAHLHAERTDIRSEWRRRMQERLSLAHSQLLAVQRTRRFRDEALEAELTEQITLLQNELASFNQNTDF